MNLSDLKRNAYMLRGSDAKRGNMPITNGMA